MRLSYVWRDRRGFLGLGAGAAGEIVGTVGGGIFNADLKPGGCVEGGPQGSLRDVMANVAREIGNVGRTGQQRYNQLTASPDWRNQLGLLAASQAPMARGGPPGAEEAFDCPELGVMAASLLSQWDALTRLYGGTGIERDQVEGAGEIERLAGSVPSQGDTMTLGPVTMAAMTGGMGFLVLAGLGLAVAAWMFRDG